jgi:hypothetical protein
LWFPNRQIEKRSFGFTGKKQSTGMTGMSHSAVPEKQTTEREKKP